MAWQEEWTQEEKDYLMANWGHKTAREIADHIGKTYKAVIMKKYYMTHSRCKVDEAYCLPPRLSETEKLFRIESLASEMRVRLLG